MKKQNLRIVEVGPRDGLQNEPEVIPTSTKVKLINQLAEVGVKSIEATAFVSPKWVPQMADHREVMQLIDRKDDVAYPVLVPNMQGYQAACEVGVSEIAVFAAASESFSQRNINCSIDESLERFRPVVERALSNDVKVRGYISCVLGCPYEGAVSMQAVSRIAEKLLQMGCYEISLGDTIGIGTPDKAKALVREVIGCIPIERVAVHFHDTYGQALANILAVLDLGVEVVDSSVAGLGGCPYAKGATGNVATEDVVYMLDGLGVETGIDLEKLARVGWEICAAINKSPASRVSAAMRGKLS